MPFLSVSVSPVLSCPVLKSCVFCNLLKQMNLDLNWYCDSAECLPGGTKSIQFTKIIRDRLPMCKLLYHQYYINSLCLRTQTEAECVLKCVVLPRWRTIQTVCKQKCVYVKWVWCKHILSKCRLSRHLNTVFQRFVDLVLQSEKCLLLCLPHIHCYSSHYMLWCSV